MKQYLKVLLPGLITIIITPSVVFSQALPPPPPLDEPRFPEDVPPTFDWFAPTLPQPSGTTTQTDQPKVAPFAARELYRVEVSGSSTLLLAQVQKIVPNAFIRQANNIIQAGVFSVPANAQEQVRDLEKQGIISKVVAISSNTSPVTNFSSQGSAYYVVIPAKRRDFPKMVAQITELGISPNQIFPRNAPRGTHIAVGPFQQSSEANHWSSYLSSSGFNARLYFGR